MISNLNQENETDEKKINLNEVKGEFKMKVEDIHEYASEFYDRQSENILFLSFIDIINEEEKENEN